MSSDCVYIYISIKGKRNSVNTHTTCLHTDNWTNAKNIQIDLWTIYSQEVMAHYARWENLTLYSSKNNHTLWANLSSISLH